MKKVVNDFIVTKPNLHPFDFCKNVKPEIVGGKIFTYNNHKRYANPRDLKLHKYGACDFCDIRLKNVPGDAGVYAVVVDGEIKYIGSSCNLRKRWGSGGYGHISPRECYEGGHSTNCHVNSAILNECQNGNNVDLYIYKTPYYISEEKCLISQYKPNWNSKNP